MTNDSIITTNGKNTMLYRMYTVNGSLSSTQYLAPTQFKVGISNGTPAATDTDLDESIPFADGTTNDDGSNTMTGSNGGDNSTDNTSTYKAGGGNTDDTAQNLITNTSSDTKTWTITNLSSAGTNITAGQPFGLWLYIADATTLAYFDVLTTAVEIKLGSDTSNYYSKTWTLSDLAVGWNWLSSGTTNVEDLTETGTVSGDIDTFIIEITTNNATDSWSSGDVVYDLLRQWASTDLYRDFVSGYPTLDYVDNEATLRCLLTTVHANGFDINGLGVFNEDTSRLMIGEDTFIGESKSNTDEFVFIIKDRVI